MSTIPDRLNAVYVLGDDLFERVYGMEAHGRIRELVNVLVEPGSGANVLEQPDVLRETDIILSTWGMHVMDESFLALVPRLKALLYGAGSVRKLVTDAFWDRNIVLSSAWAANGVPVSEYTLAAITFCLKNAFGFNRAYCGAGAWPEDRAVYGAYDSTVGLVSLGMIGRLVCERLKQLDVKVMAYDPFISAGEAESLGVTLVSIESLFSECEVVSLHTPLLKETEGLITGRLIESMKTGASFINTARGAVVREPEMIDVLRRRPDLTAVLDVTRPEPPEAGSALYSLPNVFLTPHISGSMDGECRRMGHYMVEELERFVSGQPLKWQVTEEKAKIMA